MPSSDLAETLHEAIVAAFATIASSLPGGHTERYGSVVATFTKTRMSFFNQILVDQPHATRSDMETALGEMISAGNGFTAHLRSGEDDHVVDLLEASPAQRASSKPTAGMALQNAPDYRFPADLEIKRGADVLADHATIVARGFDISPDVVDTFLIPSLTDRDELTFYTGYVDGEPAATAFGLRGNSTLTLFSVATLPGFRRRGFGTALTMRATNDGLEAGCDLIALQASEMGYPVYERLGFETVVEYTQWHAPFTDS